MKIVDPGHTYALGVLDGAEEVQETLLVFVKRVGEKFPGNEPPARPGTTTQEVIRALIDRTQYVDNQDPHKANWEVIVCLRYCLWELEWRAADRRGEGHKFPGVNGRSWDPHDPVEQEPTCPTCGHIRCGIH